jgi:hypothetical protein
MIVLHQAGGARFMMPKARMVKYQGWRGKHRTLVGILCSRSNDLRFVQRKPGFDCQPFRKAIVEIRFPCLGGKSEQGDKKCNGKRAHRHSIPGATGELERDDLLQERTRHSTPRRIRLQVFAGIGTNCDPQHQATNQMAYSADTRGSKNWQGKRTT